MNTPENDKRHTDTAEPHPEPRALVPYEYRNDEIDLVEVGVSLWHRWKLMVAVFLVCVGLALALAFIIPRSYNYTTTIEIGNHVVGSKIQPVESPNSAVSKLQQGYLPEVARQYAKTHRVDPRKFKFDVKAPAKTNLVIISGKGTVRQATAYRAIEKSAAQLLAASDVRITRNQQAQLRTQVAEAQAKLVQLKNPANRKLLKSQIDNLEAYQKQAQDQQIATSRHSNSANSAMSLLLLGTQALQANQQLLTLRQQLNNLPSDIESHQATVKGLQTQLDNIQATRIAAGPMQSLKPAGLGRAVIAVLGAVIGVILALLAAAIANYLAAVHQRLAAKRDESA